MSTGSTTLLPCSAIQDIKMSSCARALCDHPCPVPSHPIYMSHHVVLLCVVVHGSNSSKNAVSSNLLHYQLNTPPQSALRLR